MASNTEALKPCPFCGCSMRVQSNRDWHRLMGGHDEDCIFNAEDAAEMVPASDDALTASIARWNRRAEQPSTASMPATQSDNVYAKGDSVNMLDSKAPIDERDAFQQHWAVCGFVPDDASTDHIYAAMQSGFGAGWQAAMQVRQVPDGMLDRIKSAQERIFNNHAPRRIPADPTDVDLVLKEVEYFLTGQFPPFWIAASQEKKE